MKVIHSADRPTIIRDEPLPSLQRLVDRDAGSNHNTVIVNKLTKGQRIPEQSQRFEEIIIVTDGQCSVKVGDEEETLSAGDAVVVPPHAVHSLRQLDDNPSTVIAVLATPDLAIDIPE